MSSNRVAKFLAAILILIVETDALSQHKLIETTTNGNENNLPVWKFLEALNKQFINILRNNIQFADFLNKSLVQSGAQKDDVDVGTQKDKAQLVGIGIRSDEIESASRNNDKVMRDEGQMDKIVNDDVVDLTQSDEAQNDDEECNGDDQDDSENDDDDVQNNEADEIDSQNNDVVSSVRVQEDDVSQNDESQNDDAARTNEVQNDATIQDEELMKHFKTLFTYANKVT